MSQREQLHSWHSVVKPRSHGCCAQGTCPTNAPSLALLSTQSRQHYNANCFMPCCQQLLLLCCLPLTHTGSPLLGHTRCQPPARRQGYLQHTASSWEFGGQPGARLASITAVLTPLMHSTPCALAVPAQHAGPVDSSWAPLAHSIACCCYCPTGTHLLEHGSRPRSCPATLGCWRGAWHGLKDLPVHMRCLFEHKYCICEWLWMSYRLWVQRTCPLCMFAALAPWSPPSCVQAHLLRGCRIECP